MVIAAVRPRLAVGEEIGCTPAQAALAWVLAQGEDIVAIPGTKRVSYLEENAAASELALTGSHAEKRLRMLAMEYLATQGASAAASASGNPPRPSPSDRPPAASAAPNPSSRALPGLAASAMLGSRDAAHSMVRSLSGIRESGTAHGVVGRDNPYQPLVRGYSKLSVQALRFLGTYLEKAPLPQRTAAAAELERLNLDHQPWHQVAQIARQAALLEQTPELKKRLGKLDPRGGAARPRK